MRSSPSDEVPADDTKKKKQPKKKRIKKPRAPIDPSALSFSFSLSLSLSASFMIMIAITAYDYRVAGVGCHDDCRRAFFCLLLVCWLVCLFCLFVCRVVGRAR